MPAPSGSGRAARIICCPNVEPAVPPDNIAELDSMSAWDGDLQELVVPPADEPASSPLPLPLPRKPSDRVAHRKALEESFAIAHSIVQANSRVAFHHARCCVAGLGIVIGLRVSAGCTGISPGAVLVGIHWLASTSDALCVASALPFCAQGTTGCCVSLGCIGPMLTLIFSMCIADVGALAGYLAIATPRPLTAGQRSLETVLQAMFGAWELLLFSSVALQIGLCVCCWRIYRELRLAGLYPPGQIPLGEPLGGYVSSFELVCEAGDAQVWSERCRGGDFMLCPDVEEGETVIAMPTLPDAPLVKAPAPEGDTSAQPSSSCEPLVKQLRLPAEAIA